MSLPPTPSGAGHILRWGDYNYIGPLADVWLTGKPVLDAYWYMKKNNDLSSEDSWTGIKFEQGIKSLIPKILEMNIKYLLLHKDFSDSYPPRTTTKSLKIDGMQKSRTLEQEFLNIPQIKLLIKNDFFNLYEVKKEYYTPLIYPLKNNENFNEKQDEKKTEVIFRKINPTKYYVSIKNIHEPFWLIFNESFDKGWKIYPSLWKEEKTEMSDLKIYEKFNTTEAKALNKYTFQDILLFFEQPLNFNHQRYKDYGNAWYINFSGKDKLGEKDFIIFY